MELIEAIQQRRSIRAFKPDPVPKEVLKQILELSLRAPSWANTQPWEFGVVAGEKLAEIKQAFAEKAGESPHSDLTRPEEFPEPQHTRRQTLGRKIFEIRGIGREDRAKRKQWELQGLNFFGAPCVIYILIDRQLYFQRDSLNVWPILDCGLVAENIMLLATQYGLGTITQARAVGYPDVLRRILGIPDSRLIVVGIAIGYPDWTDPITRFRSEREPLDKVAEWYGFD